MYKKFDLLKRIMKEKNAKTTSIFPIPYVIREGEEEHYCSLEYDY